MTIFLRSKNKTQIKTNKISELCIRQICPVVYAFESSVSSLNDFHLGNRKAVLVEISLHAIEIHSKQCWTLIVVELRHKDRFHLFRFRGLEKKQND